MAKSDIQLNIGSRFNGEGFKKLNQSVKGAAAQTRNATKNINGVVQALGGVEGQVGKIFNNIGGLMGAFAQGGIFGLAVAGIGTAFKFVMDKIEEAKKKAEEAAKAMKESFQKMFDGLGDKISRIRADGAGTMEQRSYDRSRLEKDMTREQKQQIAKIRSEGIDRRSDMTSAEEKAVDLAKEELKIQQLITKNLKEQNDLKVTNATKDYNTKLQTHESSVKKVNEAIETYLSKVGEIDKKIEEQQKKLADAEKRNASPDRFQTFTSTAGGTITVDTGVDTKPIEAEIKKLTAQKEELYDIKQKAVEKIDLAKSEKEVQRALDAVIDANKDRAVAVAEAALSEKQYAQKVKDAEKKMEEALKPTGWNNGKGEGVNDPSKFGEEENKKIEDQQRKSLLQEQADITKEGNRKQKEFNDKLAQARSALNDWVANLNNGGGNNFGDWNKQQNQAEKGKVQAMGADGKPVMGADGKPVMIDKKQANAVKSNKQLLDRMTNKYDKDGDGKLSEDEMKKMDDRSRKEYERRLAFDEQFNPEKITEKQDAIQDIINQQLQAQIDMNTNLQKIQDKLDNLGL